MTQEVALIAPELRERILVAACSGLGPDAAIQPLIEQGWDRDRATEAVEAILTTFVAEQARAQSLPPPVRAPAPIGLNGPGVMNLPDRKVYVLTHLRHPRVIVFGGLLADAECKNLIALARDELTPSRVVDGRSGAAELHAGRTSDGMYFLRGANPLVQRIEQRIAALVDWPLDQTEGLQILHYGPGARYETHYDYFDPREAGTAAHIANGGQRVASLVMYLNTPAVGGATVFADAGLEVAAIRGNAVFFSYGMPHPLSKTLHGGAPVIEGDKWIATKMVSRARLLMSLPPLSIDPNPGDLLSSRRHFSAVLLILPRMVSRRQHALQARRPRAFTSGCRNPAHPTDAKRTQHSSAHDSLRGAEHLRCRQDRIAGHGRQCHDQ